MLKHFPLFRRAEVTEYEQNAMQKAYNDHIKEKTNKEDWGKYYRNTMTERIEYKKNLQVQEDNLLDLADDQDEQHYCFNQKGKNDRKQRTIR